MAASLTQPSDDGHVQNPVWDLSFRALKYITRCYSSSQVVWKSRLIPWGAYPFTLFLYANHGFV